MTPGTSPTPPQTAQQAPQPHHPPAAGSNDFIVKFSAVKQRLLGELHKVIIGQDEVIELLLAGLFARGHCLLVGVPGDRKSVV